jgi:hypothetical protein
MKNNKILIAQWFANGDRQLTVRRENGVHYFTIMAYDMRAYKAAGSEGIVFRPDKEYKLVLKENTFELWEEPMKFEREVEE